MTRFEDRLARVEAELDAVPRVRPRGCRPGIRFDFDVELAHASRCRSKECARRDAFLNPRSEQHRERMASLIRAELARRECEGNVEEA